MRETDPPSWPGPGGPWPDTDTWENEGAPARSEADGGVDAMPDGWSYPVTSERFHELSTGPTSW